MTSVSFHSVHISKPIKIWWNRFRQEASSLLDIRELTLICVIVVYTAVFSVYLIDKYADLRTGYFDFGNAVQLVWLASHGHITAYVLSRPIMLVAAGASLLAPVPQVLLVMESALLASGAIPVYLISRFLLRNRWQAVLLGVLYLVYPPLTGVIQYEFHDLSLCVPFVLFLYYAYLSRNFKLFVVSAAFCLFTTEYMVVALGFFGLMIIWDYFADGKQSVLLRYVVAIFAMAALWAGYLQIIPLVPTYVLPTVSTGAYSLSGSASFIDPLNALENLPYSFGYALPSKLLYVLLLFGPLLFLPVLSPRRLLPALPWLLVIFLYSPLIATGGVGAVYSVWSQWSAFVIPFVFVAGITALSELTPHSEDKPTNFEDSRRPLLTLMCVVMALVVVSTGALSPFQEQNTLSGGDNLVPTDVPSGAVYHGFWPTPVSNASTILYFISLVPQQYLCADPESNRLYAC